MIKLAGALCIVLSASYIGFYRAETLRKRLMYLRNIKISLNMLESEISFSQNILERVFKRIDGISNTEGLFLKTSERIGEMGIKMAWNTSVDDVSADMCLKKQDKEALYIFGEGLGMSDKDNQIKNIRHTENMIDSLLNEAEDEYRKNGRLYRSAGFLTGLFAAVILY